MTIYEEYSKLKIQIKVAQEKLKEIEPKILDEIKGLSEPMKTEMGTFTKVVRESYKYSESVKKVEESVKPELEELSEKIGKLNEKVEQAKELDIKTGKAEKVETVGLRFIENKGKV